MKDQAENLRKLANQNKKKKTNCVTLTVASGKGGTGKTSFSINFAIALAEHGKSVLILDADFGLSNVDVMLGAHPKHHLGEVVNGDITLEEALCQGHGGIWYVGGGSGITELFSLHGEKLEKLTNGILGLENRMDYIIFDCGAGVNEQVLQIMGMTDETVLVITPEPTSIVDAFALTKKLTEEGMKQPINFVINRCETPMEGMIGARQFKNVVQKYLRREMNYIGYVRFDKAAMHAIKRQMPFLLSFPTSFAAQDVRTVAADYMGAPKPRKGGALKNFFDRLVMNRGQ